MHRLAESVHPTPDSFAMLSKREMDVLVVLYAIGPATRKHVNDFLGRGPTTRRIHGMSGLVNRGLVTVTHRPSEVSGRPPRWYELTPTARVTAGFLYSAYRSFPLCVST